MINLAMHTAHLPPRTLSLCANNRVFRQATTNSTNLAGRGLDRRPVPSACAPTNVVGTVVCARLHPEKVVKQYPLDLWIPQSTNHVGCYA